jgi:hypothetical protein
LALAAGCQVTRLADEFRQVAPVEPQSIQVRKSGDVVLTLMFRLPMRADILASRSAEAPLEVVGSVVGQESQAVEWVDAGAAVAPGVRYYRVAVQSGDARWEHAREFAVFVQPRAAGTRALISIPVDLGAGNRLDGELGRQLARGLHAGTDTNDADAIQYMTEGGGWRHVYRMRPEGREACWWDPLDGLASTVAIAPGQGFWVIRGAGAPDDGHTTGAFWGPTYTRPLPVRFRVDNQIGTPFGLPWSRPLHHRPLDAAARADGALVDPLGFGALGSGGTTSDPRRPDECGDQIWVWAQGEWSGYIWLMDHLKPERDGRWWDNRTRDLADFSLIPGEGYYYRHRANRWGGTDFVWVPPIPAEIIDD